MKKHKVIAATALVLAFGPLVINPPAITSQSPSQKNELSTVDPYDINNYKRTIEFSGYEFKVKDSSISSTGTLGPNNNIFSDSTDNVKVDKNGKLILQLSNKNNAWQAAEVISKDDFGYGKYIFKLESRIDLLDPNVTFSPFLYKDDLNEIDIEFSNFGTYNSQFIVQPYYIEGNLNTFKTSLNGSYSSYVLDYQKNYVKFEAYHGHNVNNKNNLIKSWEYKGEIPHEEGMKLRFNLYIRNSDKPVNNKTQKVIINSFDYIKSNN